MRSRACGASNRRCIHHGPLHRVHGTPDGAALLAADDPTHPTVVTPLARPTVFTPSIPLTVGVMHVRHAGEGGEPHSDCSFRRHRRVFTPSTPLAVGGLRVRLVCEGGKPNQTAHSVATDAPHRLHTSCTPRRLHTSYAPHRLHAVDSTGRRRPARAPRLLRDPPSTHLRYQVCGNGTRAILSHGTTVR